MRNTKTQQERSEREAQKTENNTCHVNGCNNSAEPFEWFCATCEETHAEHQRAFEEERHSEHTGW